MRLTEKLRPLVVLAILATILPIGCRRETIKLVPERNTQSQKNDTNKDIQPTKTLLKSLAGAGDTVKIKSQEQNIEILLKNTSSSYWFRDILPIISLLLGILIKELLDNFGTRRNTKKIGKRWKTELQLLVEPLQKQVQEIKNSIEHHKSEYNEPPQIVSVVALECENFEALDKGELLTYINRYYLKDYGKAVSLTGRINLQLSIIRSNSKSLKERFLKALEDAGKSHDKLNENFQELIQSLHKYKTALVLSDGKDALYGDKFKNFDKLYGEHVLPHIEDGKFDYIHLRDNYFTPMINELERLAADNRTDEMTIFTRRCLDSVAGLKMEITY